MRHKSILCKKILFGIMIVVFTIITIGCNKKDVKKNNEKTLKKKITASDIIDKVVDNYSSKKIKDVKIESNATLTSDKDKSMNVGIVVHNSFVDNDTKKCITNLNLKINVDKKENVIDLFINEQGNVVYSLNKSDYYSADEIYGMLGINYSAPKLENSDKSAKNTEEPSITGSIEKPSESSTSNVEDISQTVSPRKVYTIEDLKGISKKLVLEGTNEINGVECYVLKGKINSVEISNFFVKNFTEGLYEIPKEFGDIIYEIYVTKANYDINSVALDCKNLVSTLSGGEEIESNVVSLNITYNTGKNLTFPKGKAFELERYSDILNLIGEITIGLRNMKVK